MTRKFLLLQGNASPFYLALGRALDARGYGVAHINMSGGDWFFWRDWKAVDFKGALDEYGAFVRSYVETNAITDLVMFNDCRPHHRHAIEEVRDLDCRIWVFEEGYMRPHWVTLEEGGVNGHSPLMSRMALHLESANDNAGDETDFVSLPPGMKRRVIYDFQWQIWNYLLLLRYPRFRTHRPFPIWAEYATWLTRLVAMPWRRRHAKKTIERLVEEKEKFFLFPMQLDTDSQVKIHSPFRGMTDALEEVISSFARHAPADARLVVKAHPLDNGWIHFGRRTREMAHRFGIEERVDYIDGGDLALLLRHAQGTVLLNSTVGLTALEMGCPLICLGKAIFDLPGLTSRGDLAAFWKAPERPRGALFSLFLRHLRRESLINGDYYTDEGVGLAVKNAIARFETSCRDPGDAGKEGCRQTTAREVETEAASFREDFRRRPEGRREGLSGAAPHQ